MPQLPPLIALSMGDPGGIGPEIVAELSRDKDLLSRARILCFGDRGALTEGARTRKIDLDLAAEAELGRMALVEVTALPLEARVPGRQNPGAGLAQRAYLDAALHAVVEGRAQALCTAPVTKALVDREAGPFTGH